MPIPQRHNLSPDDISVEHRVSFLYRRAYDNIAIEATAGVSIPAVLQANAAMIDLQVIQASKFSRQQLLMMYWESIGYQASPNAGTSSNNMVSDSIHSSPPPSSAPTCAVLIGCTQRSAH